MLHDIHIYMCKHTNPYRKTRSKINFEDLQNKFESRTINENLQNYVFLILIIHTDLKLLRMDASQSVSLVLDHIDSTIIITIGTFSV